MIFKSPRYKVVLTSLSALTVFLPMTACDLSKNFTKIDRSTNSEVQDYRDALAPRELETSAAKGGDSATPELAPYVVENSDSLKSMPLVSLSINQSIPLREAIFELAKQANFDVELDPRISGSIIFTTRNKPFDEVIDRVCEISGLRYKFDGGTLRVELDTPYSKNYKIDYLNFVRKNDSGIKTDVSISSSGGASSDGGSKFSIDNKSESDFWAELDVNIKQILTSNATPNYMKTNEDPQIALTAAAPVSSTGAVAPPVPPISAAALSATAPQAGGDDYVSAPQLVTQQTMVASPTSTDSAVPVPSDAGLATAATSTSTSGTSTTATSTSATSSTAVSAASTAATTSTSTSTSAQAGTTKAADASTVVSPPSSGEKTETPAPKSIAAQPATPAQQPVLKVESLPTSPVSGSSGANAVQFTPAYSINKQAGIISVYANQRMQKQVESYLTALRRSVTSQVLIEAKVLEVSLSDEFSAGINWSLLDHVGDFRLTSMGFEAPSLSPAATSTGFKFGFAGNDISSFVSALSRFGTVHALASPRLAVLNNQAAILNVAKNQVYFEIKVTTTPATAVGLQPTVTYESTAKTVPEGIIINVMPSIDLSKRMVSMQVRPTITKIDHYVSDPSISLNKGTVESKIPVMNVQETDSVLNLKDKQMMVMGGLLQDSTISQQEGIPVASEVPVFGGLFRNQGDKVEKKELVVFIKATILDDASESVYQADKDLYRVFGQDRRPSKL